MAKLRSLIWLVLLSSAFDHVVCVVDSCFSVQMKYMDNFIPQESELWQVDIPSQNSIACGYFCKNDGSCAAVSFNTQSYTCKGYSSITDDLTEATTEDGSIYYLMECRS